MTAPTTIHLLKPHRHAGRDYPAGAELTLPQRKAAWLIGVGVATAARPAHLADMTSSPLAPATAVGEGQGEGDAAKPRARRTSKDTTKD